MNSWLAWAVFFLVVLVLGWVGYHFSLRALRIVTTFAASLGGRHHLVRFNAPGRDAR